MRAALDDPALVDHQDAVGAHDRAEPVGDDERRAALQEVFPASCTSISVAVSTALVASSSMKMRGSARNARVKQISCRWPRLMLRRARRLRCRSHLASDMIASWLPIALAAAITSSSVASGLGIANIFHHRAGEEIIHLQHQAHLLVQRFAGRRGGCPGRPPARGPSAADRSGRSAR